MTATNQIILGHALQALGAAVGNPLRLGEDGVATLAFAGTQELTVEAPAGSDRIFIHGRIGRLPAQGSDAAAREALARNLFKLPIAGAWIALDEGAGTLLLCCSVPAEAIAQGGLASLLLSMFTEQAQLTSAFAQSDFGMRHAAQADRHQPLSAFALRM
jgi:hypothetical protein